MWRQALRFEYTLAVLVERVAASSALLVWWLPCLLYKFITIDLRKALLMTRLQDDRK